MLILNKVWRITQLYGLVPLVAAVMLAGPAMAGGDSPDAAANAVRQALSAAAAVPMIMKSQRLGPHPADPHYAAFQARLTKDIERERAINQDTLAAARRARSLD